MSCSSSLARRATTAAVARRQLGGMQGDSIRPLPRNITSRAIATLSTTTSGARATHSRTGGCECCCSIPPLPSSWMLGRSFSSLSTTICRQTESSGRNTRRRWASSPSSSSSSNEDDNESDSNNPTAATTTTPLSEVSADDLQLAAAAALHPDSGQQDQSQTNTDPSQPMHDHLSDIPGAQSGGGKKLAIVFTCAVCSTRSAKKFSEQAYNHGVVLVRCPGCQNLHLIADRLGFFTDDEIDGNGDGTGWDIQKALEQRGDDLVAVTDDNVLELTMADVLGKEKFEALVDGDVGNNGDGDLKKDD